jgi:hypothetical protein
VPVQTIRTAVESLANAFSDDQPIAQGMKIRTAVAEDTRVVRSFRNVKAEDRGQLVEQARKQLARNFPVMDAADRCDP